jgi:hypothetical protein
VLVASPASAQRTGEARAGVADTARAQTAATTGSPAPLSPARAFFYSFLVPGLGQAKLDRPIVGAGFFLVEVAAIGFIHRTTDDLRVARSFSRDSLPATYAVDANTGLPQLDGHGNPVVSTWLPPAYSADLVKARRLQLEDWTSVLIFNHLIAGAEAFVASQLWDLPEHVKFRTAPVRGGYALGLVIRTP